MCAALFIGAHELTCRRRPRNFSPRARGDCAQSLLLRQRATCRPIAATFCSAVRRTKLKFDAVTRLQDMPTAPKAMLLSGAALLGASAYMLGFASSRCFEPFDLSDDVDEVLCLSCERAAVKAMGWVALGMLAYGLLCMWGFGRWADAATARAAAPRLEPPPAPAPAAPASASERASAPSSTTGSKKWLGNVPLELEAGHAQPGQTLISI